MATVFKRKGKGAWIIQYFDASGRRRERSSRTTDRRAAERIAGKLEADVALRRDGVIDARQDRFAEEGRKPLAKHVEDYLEHCRSKGLAKHTIEDKQRHLEWLMQQTGASRLADLTLDAVERALAAFRAQGRAARTVNTRRETFRAFGNWCRKTSRLGSHPLELLAKLDEHRDRRRVRRPLSDEELARLLAVAEERGRRAWYLTAALAGLRRSELIRLTWASVDLEGGVLTIRDGKAKREDLVPLHPELLEELKRVRPAGAKPSDRVFPKEVTNVTRKRDFERAGIELVDERGRVADLHGLRATLGTRLARAGVAPQVAQRLMRHADYRTTLQHYTMLSLADTVAAMTRLPGGGDGRGSAGESAGGAAASEGEHEESGAETGEPLVEEPQHWPQQSAHETTRSGARGRESDGATARHRGARKSQRVRALREAARDDASECESEEEPAETAKTGLGTGCSLH